MEPLQSPIPALGVAIVAFQSAAIITACLDSLAASEGVRLRIVVLDNASDDETAARVREWADRRGPGFTFAQGAPGDRDLPLADLVLLRSPVNAGFAWGSNRALDVLLADPSLDMFWLLNPDARARPDAARRYAETGADGAFALMGGRTVFAEMPGTVQTDGGRVSLWTGRCVSVNWGRAAAECAVPTGDRLDYITGANCVASRGFIEAAGLMPEDYFLFYEEVDWALRRGRMPLRTVPEAVVEHVGGAVIGSAAAGRTASAFACYFTHRNRRRFVRRYRALALPLWFARSMAEAGRFAVQGAWAQAGATLRGALGLAPPAAVRNRLSIEAQALAFGRG